MFAIAGVTGNTGSVVAETLIREGKKVRAIVRDASKAQDWRNRGAEIAVASLDDADALARALEGTEGAYLLIPPDIQTDDVIGRGRRFVDAIAKAIEKSRVPHVVFLSSIGAQHTEGTGPIKTVHYAEERLPAIKSTVFTFVRAAYFMENELGMMGAMTGQGVLPATFDPQKKVSMVATRDIGQTAARALAEGPHGNRVIELAGPTEYSVADAAAAFGKALGRAISPVRIPEAGVVPAFTQAGFSKNVSEQFAEMSRALERGLVAWQRERTQFVRGQVTLEEFASRSVQH